MRIGIVPIGGEDWIAGVIYLQNLVRALDLLPKDDRPSLYFILGHGTALDAYQELGKCLPPLKYYAFRSNDSLALKIIRTIRHAGLPHWPTSFEQVTRRLNISTLFPVLTSLGPHFLCPWIGWIPDFQHKRMPQFFSEDELRSRDDRFQRVAREASHVVVSSQDAHRDLMRWFPTTPDRVSVLPFVSVATEEWYAGNPQEVVARFGLPKKYLVFPSQFWVHKNHRCVFQAIRILKDSLSPDIALVCTGRMHDYRHRRYSEELLTELKEYGLERNVYCLGLLGRHTQIQILRGAAAVIQPSWFEGWSSLVEDARTLAKRLYVSDIPIHREQDPPDAQFFKPESPEELATLIAGDWDHLSPGPDHSKEQEAFSLQRARAVNFARLFLQITREVRDLG